MEKLTEQIMQRLDCDCMVIPPQEDSNLIFEIYKKERDKGKTEGYTPVILVPDEMLADHLKQAAKVSFYTDEYKKHDGKEIIEGYLREIKDCLQKQGEPWEDVVSTVERGQEIAEFAGYLLPDWNETLEVILARIPTTKPWEIFAWISIGGWNECPPTEYIIAIMKHWNERYGFCPVVVTGDMIEGLVSDKVKSDEEALKLATEQYAFCPDLVEQCCADATIGQLADTLLQSKIWFFWWD